MSFRQRTMFSTLCGALVLYSPPTPAATVVVLTENAVAQYREALSGAQQVQSGLEIIDLASGDAKAALKRASPDAILVIGQKALDLATQTMPNTPVVFCMVLGASGDPAKSVTGIRMEVHPARQIEYFQQISPSARRLGMIYDPRTSRAYVDSAMRAAKGAGFSIVAEPVNDAKEVKAALGKIVSQIDALWLTPDPRLVTAEMFSYLLVTTIEQKIALFGFLDAFARAGALAAVSPDHQATGQAAARMVLEIATTLRDKRATLPEPSFGPGALSLNLKTARRLGLDVPQNVISLARQVYR